MKLGINEVKLKYLLKGIQGLEIKGPKEIEISGLSNNSKLVAPGSLFFAKKGTKLHGNAFIAEAKMAGAIAVATDLYNPFLKDLTQLIYPDIVELEWVLAERFYKSASKDLLCVGITGTNGKTTSSYLIKHLFEGMGISTGLIGTIEWIIKDTVFPSSLTTPDSITNQKLLREMVLNGCKSVVMEVSSHALDQKRVSGIEFDIALFTNLTQDHLDYHATMDEYAKAKSKLFSSLGNSVSKKKQPKKAILNQDSPWVEKMQEAVSVPSITYGLLNKADLMAEEIELTPQGTKCVIVYQGQRLAFVSSLIGKFNVYNFLGVIGVGLSLGWDLSQILSILSSFTSVPGRLERVENIQKKHIFVDYAHTDDALKNVLETLREISKGRIFCVFGCGGNRDKQKRPLMGKVAESFSDVVFVTSDNPRNEDPKDILSDILQGIQSRDRVKVEIDRKKAIEEAISQMQAEDVLLIAGKGHENYQIFSHQKVHFDDRIIAKEYCRNE